MSTDSMSECAQYKLTIVYTKHDTRNTRLSMFFLNKIKFLSFHAIVVIIVLVKTLPLMYQLLLLD